MIGELGDGLVEITINDAHDCCCIEIDPSVLEDDKDILEDLIAMTSNDAVNRIA